MKTISFKRLNWALQQINSKFVFRDKQQSKFMRLLSIVLFFVKGFIKSFWTQLGNIIYVPSELWINSEEKISFSEFISHNQLPAWLTAPPIHEASHFFQRQLASFFKIKYIFSFKSRYQYELEAYTVTLMVNLFADNSDILILNRNYELLGEQFEHSSIYRIMQNLSGPNYLYANPNKRKVFANLETNLNLLIQKYLNLTENIKFESPVLNRFWDLCKDLYGIDPTLQIKYVSLYSELNSVTYQVLTDTLLEGRRNK